MNEQLKRPNHDTKEVRLAAFEKIADKIIKEYGNDFGTKEEIVRDLDSYYQPYYSTYKLAKDLDDYNSWEIDDDIIDTLSNLDSIFYELIQDATKKWIKENNIKPKFKIGDKVEFQQNNTKHTGEITKVNETEGKYHIFCEQIHVKSGTGSYASILTWEKVDC